MRSFENLGCRVTIGFERFGKIGFCTGNGIGRGDVNGLGNKGFKHDELLGWMIVGVCTKAPIDVSLISIDLVSKEAIKKATYKYIMRGERMVVF